MPEKWTGDLIGRMHNERVTQDDLAGELNCGKAYISMILNGARSPADAESRLNAAFEAVLAKRSRISSAANPAIHDQTEEE